VHAFLWTGGTMIDLGTLGGLYSEATAVNDLGQVTGSARTPDNVSHPFRLTPEDTDGDGRPDLWYRDRDGDGANDLMTPLGLPGGTTRGGGLDINSAGQVVGFAGDASVGDHAVLWTAAGATDLGTSGGMSEARGINDAGQVVGDAQDAVGISHAFLWDGMHGMTDLGSPAGYPNAWASSIDRSGRVVGGVGDPASGAGCGFLWAPGQPNGATGTMSVLAPLPGDNGANAVGLNDAGQVVGSSTYTYYVGDPNAPTTSDPQPVTISRPVVWEGGAPAALSSLVVGNPGLAVDEAAAINAGGQIVGAGSDSSGARRAILLKPWDGPLVSINDVTVVEGNSGTRTATFTVTLSAASDQTVTVDYHTIHGGASAGSDYRATSGTLTFAPSETTKTITVLVVGDRLAEPDETFLVSLSSPVNAIVTDGLGVGTILDDEPRISISDVTKSEGKKGQTTYFTRQGWNRVRRSTVRATSRPRTSPSTRFLAPSEPPGTAPPRCLVYAPEWPPFP